MSLPQFSLAAARNLHLAAQGLLKKPRRRAQPADILSTVQRMSLLQIDTINIVARARIWSCLAAWETILRSGWIMR